MFYSQFILAKKGPLGTIWIAAHLERKLRKNQVTETNIGVSVDSILFPEVPIALRLSGHLLLGVVRIYSRKVNYLFHDCSEALVKIKQAFHSGAVDLPPEAATAPFHSITLPENFDFDDLELLPDREALFLANSSVDHHVTSREQITLQDTVDDTAYLTTQFGLDERLDAPRLELDEDVLPSKTSLGIDQEEAPVLEEDVLPAVEDNDDVIEGCEERGKDGASAVIEEQMQDFPDLNEEQPPPQAEAEAETGPSEQRGATSSNEALDMNVIPDQVEAELPIPASDAQTELGEPCSQAEEKEGTQEVEGAIAAVELQADSVAATDVEEIDKDAVEETEKDADKRQPAGEDAEARTSEEEEVPEVEKLRSDVDVPEPEHDHGMLDLQPESAQKLVVNGQPEPEEGAPQQTPLLKEDTVQSALRASPPSMDLTGDGDVLASILGRRSLKVAPTPELHPAKRQKPGPKPGNSRKRKAQVDEATVLHADDMRQQLSDTTDIRRARKRAPCNEYEIWNLEKEVQGQQIFDEPLVLGSCENIRLIYRCIFSAGDAKVSVESETTQVSGKHKHQLDCVESGEAITLADEPLDDYDLYDSQRAYRFDEEELEDHCLAELREARTGESVTPAQAAETPAPVEASDPKPVADGGEELEKERADVNTEEHAADEQRQVTPVETEAEAEAEAEPVSEKAESTVCNSSSENNASNDEHASNNQQTEAEVKELEGADVEAQPQAMEVDAPEPQPSVAAQGLDGEQELQPVSVEDMAGPEVEQAHDAAAVAEDATTVASVPESHAEERDDAVVKELVFLTDAKDEDGDDADEYDADYSDAQVQDNSGWSVRTRAVCQYLRTTFESMELLQSRSSKSSGTPKLDLDRLLQGKTRRECARMFFESLVLKSKDFINVEQSAPFDNIYISARAKLMKVDL